MNFDYKENGGKNSMQVQGINIVHPNEGNMIVVPITKRIEIIISVQGISLRMNFDYKENG